MKVRTPEGSTVAATVQVLEFLYTRHVELDRSCVLEVLIAADISLLAYRRSQV